MMRRVFLSHTSEFSEYPDKRSFIDAAVDAVVRAECMPSDMKYFTARDQKPAQYCVDEVRKCDVFVGIIGFRYGSPVRDRPEVSYTELEFETVADKPKMKRFVFLLHERAEVPIRLFTDNSYANRQEAFRERLKQDADVTWKPFSDFHELEKLIYQALVQPPVPPDDNKKPEPIEWDKDKSPYPGLEWFDDKYAPLFFGRDQEVDELVKKLSKPNGRFLIISGPSGSGKSSLVAAGLYQALIDEGGLPDSKEWKWQRITPGADKRGPFTSLAAGLRHAFPKLSVTADDFALALASGPTAFATHITPQLNRRQELLLFIDQLEELFTHSAASEESRLAEARSFLAWLVETSANPQNRLRVVATIQSEYLGKVADSEGILQKINEGFHRAIGTISTTALRKMITLPAKKTGYEFESGLVDKILDEAVKEPGNLPLVAYALKQLFEQRQGRTFTCTVYQAMGGLTGAIGTEADKALAKFGQQADVALDKVFSELVHIGGDRSVTCKRARMSEFTNDKDAEKIVRALAGSDCRVLVIDRDTCGETVEVAHEKLLEAWPRMAKWLEDNKSFVDWRDQLRGRVRDWQRNNTDVGTLLRGMLLEEAQDWRFRKAAVLTNEETVYIEHSADVHELTVQAERTVQAEQLQAKKELVRTRWFTLVLLILFLTTSMAFWLWYNKYTTIHQAWLRIQSVFGSIHEPPAMETIQAGIFQMGDVEELRESRRNPVHKVEIKKDFKMGKYEVTFEEYDRFAIATRRPLPDDMGWGRDSRPVINVSWEDATEYAKWLSQKTSEPYRLPTESEWEYAARSGTTQAWAGTSDPSQLKNYAVFQGNSEDKPAVIHTKEHNGFKLFDMSGNVGEWVADCWHEDYKDAPLDESAWLEANKGDCHQRVQRGGSWTTSWQTLRVAHRTMYPTSYKSSNVGFRLAKDLPR